MQTRRKAGEVEVKDRVLGSAVLTAALLVLSTFVALWFAYSRRSMAPEHTLQIDPQHLELGRVWMQEDFSWRLPVANTSPATIHIDGFRVSCATLEVTPESLGIGAGETGQFMLSWDLSTTPPRQEASGAVRPFEIKLVPLVDNAMPLRSTWTECSAPSRSPPRRRTASANAASSPTWS
jgi:hypothetical protein